MRICNAKLIFSKKKCSEEHCAQQTYFYNNGGKYNQWIDKVKNLIPTWYKREYSKQQRQELHRLTITGCPIVLSRAITADRARIMEHPVAKSYLENSQMIRPNLQIFFEQIRLSSRFGQARQMWKTRGDLRRIRAIFGPNLNLLISLQAQSREPRTSLGGRLDRKGYVYKRMDALFDTYLCLYIYFLRKIREIRSKRTFFWTHIPYFLRDNTRYVSKRTSF